MIQIQRMSASKEKMSEAHIIARLQKGEDCAYELLCDNYGAMLLGVIARVVGDEADAENLLQDCFVKVWRNMASYDATKGRLATWLINIARNTAIDFTRSKYYAQKTKSQKLENIVSSSFDVAQSGFAVETIGVRQVVTNLLPQYREIIEWLYFEGYTQQEISETFKIPLGTVKTRTRLALRELRKQFDVI
jgi:RNA polymerase sigma-70 factor, ECF subfamily